MTKIDIFSGFLGAGKTTLTRGIAAGLGIQEPVTSPSFTISKEYQGEKYRLVHYDFYRLGDPGIMSEDLLDAISDKNAITIVEWGGSIRDILPEKRIKITIKNMGIVSNNVESTTVFIFSCTIVKVTINYIYITICKDVSNCSSTTSIYFS